MAKNTENGRRGWVKNRVQYFDEIAQAWLKRDTTTGRIVEAKKGTPWKGIRMERGYSPFIPFQSATALRNTDTQSVAV